MLNYFLISILVFFVSSVCAIVQYPNCSIEHNTATSWSVDCSSLNLNFIPQNLIEHPVKNLTFVYNNLNSSVKFGVWKELIHLNVAFNNLTFITNETFNGLTKLLYLNVSFNNIQSLSRDAFSVLPVLKILDLSGNLNLGKDPDSLDNALTQTLNRGLNKLYIANLDLQEIKENFLDTAIGLTLLDLSNNSLQTLPVFPKSLKILDISSNSLTTLTVHPFYYARNIYTIISENNINLTEIFADSFHGLSDLKYLSFKGCTKLEELHYGTLYFNQKLEYLSLASCNFKTLPIVLKPIFLRTPMVDLQDNPWNCNAAIKWFYLLDIPKNLTKNLRCASPTDAVLLEYYGPKHHHEILKFVLGALVIFVFIFFGIGLFFAYEMEKKKKLAHPYMPLGRGASVSSPIYISTVV